jgi:multiple antibiotic resistance protein
VEPYLESFLPLFVAINAIGILPLFISLTEGMTPGARRELLIQAATTALVVAILILFAGQFIFQTLGITLNDLRVGGGLVLLILSIVDLVFADFRRRDPQAQGDSGPDVGVVPLGIPLIIGPAAITTILIAQQSYGYLPTLVSLVANLALVVLAFSFGPALLVRLGPAATKAIAKVASLFLAAIAVAMIRAGVLGMINSGG